MPLTPEKAAHPERKPATQLAVGFWTYYAARTNVGTLCRLPVQWRRRQDWNSRQQTKRAKHPPLERCVRVRFL